jgi:uncharacterized protein YegP (UPF0339 family)
VEVAQDADGFHWVLWSGNGRMIARNAITYDTLKHCKQAIRALPGIWGKVKLIVKAS